MASISGPMAVEAPESAATAHHVPRDVNMDDGTTSNGHANGNGNSNGRKRGLSPENGNTAKKQKLSPATANGIGGGGVSRKRKVVQSSDDDEDDDDVDEDREEEEQEYDESAKRVVGSGNGKETEQHGKRDSDVHMRDDASDSSDEDAPLAARSTPTSSHIPPKAKTVHEPEAKRVVAKAKEAKSREKNVKRHEKVEELLDGAAAGSASGSGKNVGKAKRESVTSPPAAASSSGSDLSERVDDEEEEELSAASSSSSDEDKPLAKSVERTNGTASSSKAKARPAPKAKTAAKPRRKASTKAESEEEEEEEEEEPESEELSSDEDVPLAKKAKAKATPAKKPTAGSKRKAVAEKPAKPSKKAAAAAKPKALGKVKKEEADDEDDADVKPKRGAPAAKGKKAKKEEGPEDGDEEDAYKWWEEQLNADDSIKWKTCHHNGVLFPPAYVPLPKAVKMKYNGTSLTLPPESEEVAGFFAALIETEHAKDAKFRENFFRDWQMVLKSHPPKENIVIDDLDKCDFRPMWEHFEREKERKKSLSTAEKKALKAEKDKMEEPFLFAKIDGRKEKLGNFRVEPPGLFRGRGEHPRKGTFKFRLRPEDITLNISADAPIPVPNIPGKWKGVQHDATVTWLATWKENVNGQVKYVFLAAGSTWKGQSDRSKFEKARELQNHIDRIRKDYMEELKSDLMANRQRATAMYLIDRLALRAGNEKGEDEADTVGCCSLRLEHVTLIPPATIELRFLGKDSIMYEQQVEVIPQVFKNIKIFKREPKQEDDDLFDRLTTTKLNVHLKSYMPGLTAKVFRTYNASWTFQQELRHTPAKGTQAEKISAYNKANKDVAILCNHQKTVSATHASSMEKQGIKLLALKYQRMRLRHQLFSLVPKAKKSHPDLVQDESDLDSDGCESVERANLDEAVLKAQKKFERENAKAKEAGELEQGAEVLKERLREIKKEHGEIKKERKNGKCEPKGKEPNETKLLDAIQKLQDRIDAFKVGLETRESLKTVALGTSKINYIDPRLTVAWCKKYEVPVEKMFSKTLVTKFPWAIAEVENEPDWKF